MTDKKARQPEVGSESPVETPAYVAFVGRILAATARRVGRGDIGSLGQLADLRSAVDDAIRAAVVELHDTAGYSWADIGAELGITRQAAQQRYGPRP